MSKSIKKIVLSKKNQKAVDNFERYLISKGVSNKNTLKNYIYYCRKPLQLLNKDYDKLTKKDIETIFSTDELKDTTKEVIKMRFKRFLEYLGLDELADHIEFNFNVLIKINKSEDDILTEDEINKLISSAKSLKDKALIQMLIVTGGRRKEIAYLKYKDIKITDSVIWIDIHPVNGVPLKNEQSKRSIPIVANKDNPTAFYPNHVIDFYRTHIFKDDPEKPFFYSTYGNYFGEFMNLATINSSIKRIVKTAGITKNVTPHILRHTSASYDGHHLTEIMLCQKHGWKVGSKESKYYCHINDQSLANHLLKQAGVNEELVKDRSSCPRCKQDVNINDERCSMCGYTLDPELQQQEIDELKEQANRTRELENKIHEMNIKLSTDTKKLNKSHNKRFNKLEAELGNIREEHDEFAVALLGLTRGWGFQFSFAHQDGTETIAKMSKEEKEFRKFLFETIMPKVKKCTDKFTQKSGD